MITGTEQRMGQALKELQRVSKLAPVTAQTIRTVARKFNVREEDLRHEWE